MELSVLMTVRQFFNNHYLPVCMVDPTKRTLEAYEQMLRKWERLTENLPLGEITSLQIAIFRDDLKREPGKARGSTMADNTRRKHLRHLQSIIAKAGRAGPRNWDAIYLLDRIPYAKPPRAEISEPKAVAHDAIRDFLKVTVHARLPCVKGVEPGEWLRAFVLMILSTSLRYGQITALPMSSVDFAKGIVKLPKNISRKSRRDQTFHLHPVAVKALMAVRGKRALLLPQPHTKKNFYLEIDRLGSLSGIPAKVFRPHALRRTAITDLAKISSTAAQMAAGHASFQTTVDHYIATDALRDAVNKLPFFGDADLN